MIRAIQEESGRGMGVSPVRIVNVALLGCGVIGREVARLLIEDRYRLADRTGVDFRLQRILVRDCRKDRGINPALFTDRFEDILRADVDVVIEVLGGTEPAASHVRQLLANGVNVISANKTLIACHGDELEQLAAENGSTLAYEASVCGAVPVIAALRRVAGDRVRSITGIVNGSCNYILSRLTDDGISLDEALIEARQKGLVEPDPSADISGRDSAEKLAVLCAAAGFGRVSPAQIPTRGIEGVSQEDILAARRQGCVIKLLASVHREGDRIVAEVGPAFVPRRHPLASVHLENNALLIESDLGGELFLQGTGAGPRPTASAILGDLLNLARTQQLQPSPAKITAEPRAKSLYASFACDSKTLRPQRLLSVLRANSLAVSELNISGDRVTLTAPEASTSQIESTIAAVDSLQPHHSFIASRLS